MVMRRCASSHLLPLCHRAPLGPLWVLAALASPLLGLCVGLGATFEHYSLDGSGNNQGHRQWGARLTPQVHRYGICYADGISSPRFVMDAPNPNSTHAAYDACRAQCRVEQARLAGGAGSWSYLGRGPRPIDERAQACDYACNDMLGASARSISNKIFSNLKRRQAMNPKRANDLHTFFGHLMSHEMHHSRTGQSDDWPIQVPECDAWWDPDCTGRVSQPFSRFNAAAGSGTSARSPLNYLSSWIDANVIYGGDDAGGTADIFHWLRTGNASDVSFGSCKFKLEEKPDFSGAPPHEYSDVPADPLGYLQFNTGMDVLTLGAPVFASGNFRANVDPGTLGLITVFTRLHNNICDRLATEKPSNGPEDNFWLARKWVIAYMQKVFYYEYIPALIGTPLPAYEGYNASEDPALDPYHAHAAMRYGHSEVNDVFLRLDEDWRTHPSGHFLFREGILNPGKALEGGLDALLRGLMAQPQGRVDAFLIDYMVNGVLAGPARRPWTVAWGAGHCLAQRGSGSTTGRGQFDLQATNIQRGREQGLCGINTVRGAMGLPAYGNWQELVLGPQWLTAAAGDPGQSFAQELEALYGPDVDNGDFWIASLAEFKDGSHSNLGATFSRVVLDNWARVRSADRFHFQNLDNGLFTQSEVTSILRSSLAEIIRNTTRITGVPDRAFFVPEMQIASRAYPINTPTLPTLDEFNHTLMLSPYFRLSWSQASESNALDMAVSAQTLGWVGIGFVQKGFHAMMKTDMVVGRMEDGFAVVDDMYSDAITPPKRDVDRFPPGRDDLQNKNMVQENGITTLYFRKPLWTNDVWDHPVNTATGKLTMAFAFQPHGVTTLQYHGATRGYAEVQLFPPDCPGGTYLDAVRMECRTCAPGRFRAAHMPLTTCSTCALGSFQPAAAADMCKVCANESIPESTSLFLGATSASDCVCPAGAYFNQGVCKPCLEGLACPGDLGPPRQAAGYSVEVLDLERLEVSVWRCPRPEACPWGDLGSCSRGAAGVMCLSCAEPDHYWSPAGKQCIPCARSGVAWMIPTLFVVVVFAMVVVYKLALSWGHSERLTDPIQVGVALALMLFLAQAASIYGHLTIPWGNPIQDILQLAQVLNLDCGFLHLDCMLHFGFSEHYLFGCLFPLSVSVTYALAAQVLRCGGFKDAGLRCWNAVGLLAQGLFIGLLLHGVSPFIGFAHPNGKRSVLGGPDVIMGSAAHFGLSVCGVLHLLFYGGGFISYCIYACWTLRSRARNKGSRHIRPVLWHRFLYVKFKPQRYYWGTVQLVRSTCIALIPVVFETAHVQIILLDFVLCAFLAFQSFFWPYRSDWNNVADLAVSGAIISLSVAGSFFLPDNATLGNRSVVVSVMFCFGVCACVLLYDIGFLLVGRLRRTCMTEDQLAHATEALLKQRTAFYAELQQVESSELMALEAEHRGVDADAICAKPLPQVELRLLLWSTSLNGPAQGADVQFVTPGEHPCMKEVQACLRVLEERLRCRLQELSELRRGGPRGRGSPSPGSRRPSMNVVPSEIQRLDRRSYTTVAWNALERLWITQLSERVLAFQAAYAREFADDPDASTLLRRFVTCMEQRFQGVYQACVNDMLMPQPGYARAIGTARILQRMAHDSHDGAQMAADVTRGECISLIEAAVRTQEATQVYGQKLAASTGGNAPRASAKHLYRILEKQALDPRLARGGSVRCWDAARMMLLYDSMGDLAHGVEEILADHATGRVVVLRVKERFSEPTSGGWSDILVNLRFPAALAKFAQLPFEIQLVHSQMMVIRKQMGGHHGYAKYRSAKEILEYLSDAQGSTPRVQGQASGGSAAEATAAATAAAGGPELRGLVPLPGLVLPL